MTRVNPLTVTCPLCHKLPGVGCVTDMGLGTYPHQVRTQTARDAQHVIELIAARESGYDDAIRTLRSLAKEDEAKPLNERNLTQWAVCLAAADLLESLKQS